jgi:hypothetical protein
MFPQTFNLLIILWIFLWVHTQFSTNQSFCHRHVHGVQTVTLPVIIPPLTLLSNSAISLINWSTAQYSFVCYHVVPHVDAVCFSLTHFPMPSVMHQLSSRLVTHVLIPCGSPPWTGIFKGRWLIWLQGASSHEETDSWCEAFVSQGAAIDRCLGAHGTLFYQSSWLIKGALAQTRHTMILQWIWPSFEKHDQIIRSQQGPTFKLLML